MPAQKPFHKNLKKTRPEIKFFLFGVTFWNFIRLNNSLFCLNLAQLVHYLT